LARQGGRAVPRESSAGVVLAVTPSGRLTLRSPSAKFYPEGTNVVDRTRTIRGRVVRVFGPVRQPYLSVRPRRALRPAEAAALIGSSLDAEDG
jgi:rRNA processing protein Gar1